MIQEGLNHKIQRLYVHWDVSTQCNFHCSYCYAIKQYGENWGKRISFEKQKLILKAIKISSLPVFLGLLGGEPTIHPNFYELYDLCIDAVMSKDDGRIYITTNGSQSLDFFKKIPYHKNIYFLWSFHSEFLDKYNNGRPYGVILDNIKLMQERGFRNKVNIMLSDKKEYWQDLLNFTAELEKIDGIELHPHFLYSDSMDKSEIYQYSDEFYKTFEKFKNYNQEFVLDGKLYNDYEIYTNHLNRFKGWKCWNNNYEINYDGKVNRFCFDEHNDLLKNPLFFRNIKKVTPKHCPFEVCECDGLLKIHKESV